MLIIISLNLVHAFLRVKGLSPLRRCVAIKLGKLKPITRNVYSRQNSYDTFSLDYSSSPVVRSEHFDHNQKRFGPKSRHNFMTIDTNGDLTKTGKKLCQIVPTYLKFSLPTPPKKKKKMEIKIK